jgi:arylsulfatase A-like enzyme
MAREIPKSRRNPALRRRGSLVLLALVLAAAIVSACVSKRPTVPYNILLISLDTVRQDVLGCYGRRPRHAPALSPTPVLDGLAAEGVRMVDAYAPSSWTLPSHISLLTGQPPLVHGVETEGGTLARSTPTMAEVLRGHGYRTVGIYSAPYLDPHWGFARGFERYQPVYGAEVVTVAERSSKLRAETEARAAARDWAAYDRLKQQQVEVSQELNRRSEQAVTSDGVADAVVATLGDLKQAGKPWFVFAHFFDPHCDYVPPPPYDKRFDPDYTGTATGEGCMTGSWVGHPDPDRPGGIIRTVSQRDLEHVVALYEGEVAWTDAHVGAILRKLDDLDLARTTLVVVVSDHGEEFFEHGNIGHRRTLFEESVRVPMLLRLPGVLPAGTARRGPVTLTDVLPTVLDVLGLPAAKDVAGTSFVRLMQDGTAAGRTSLQRLVMMTTGNVQVDAGEPIPLRGIMVEDAFRTGALKLTRTRQWPQFPAGLRRDLNDILQAEAAKQYEQETVAWIDVERFADERPEQHSTRFADPGARTALDAFRREYSRLAPARKREESALPHNVRERLESLGYLERESGPTYPEPDVLLPPPRGG